MLVVELQLRVETQVLHLLVQEPQEYLLVLQVRLLLTQEAEEVLLMEFILVHFLEEEIQEALVHVELEVLVGEIYQTKMVPQTKVVAAEEEILFLARNQPEMSVALVDLV